MKVRKILLIIVAMMAVFLSVAKVISASGLDFSVQMAIPTNQIDNEQSYYNLLMNAGQQQTLQIKLVNTTAKRVKVAVSTNTATTNMNGTVEYATKKQSPDKSMQYSLQNYVKTPKQVTIAASGSVIVPVTVQMPKGELRGVMAGGIVFKQVNDAPASTSGMTVINEFTYTVILLMRQSQKIIAPNLALADVGVTQLNRHNALTLSLRNNQPGFLNHLTIESKVTKLGAQKVIYSTKSTDMQMAPNTTMAFPIRLGTDKFVAGDYTAHVIAYGLPAKDGKYIDTSGQHFTYKWNFTKDFVIQEAKANDLNKRSVATHGWPWWLKALIALVVILLASVIGMLIILLRKKKERKRE
ncbi:DUF916 and DUF3324 domain-containing protein [Periweissella cryptocerci]|uniref:DUF916 and DUF3324 domain-containing protein n=1 Tax=Periweissella cryptocerci TaxID=2506420 RepID=A0A4P6YTV1_9LACO|nr:DUF916 and DUF3324 domain-containing protein [Periweissella cryptocerci]QBO36113.1 DUF916 and DUF3324 domain-containing protein [Periweissella cryptocerci]